jgi:hypothetical protein
VSKLLGVLLLLPAAAAGVIGILWVWVDAVGTEWDYCPDGDCIAGWKMGLGFLAVGTALGVAAVGLLRRGRRGSGSGEPLT